MLIHPWGVLTSGIKAGVNTMTLTKALTVTAAKQLTVKVTDNEDKVVTAKTGSFSFVSPYYWGCGGSRCDSNRECDQGSY